MLVPLALLLPASAALSSGRGEALFVDVSAEALPGVATQCGSVTKEWILEVNGGGLVLADFDVDGDTDLVVVDGSTLERALAGTAGNPPRLFLNDGAGVFAPAGEAWAMGGARWGMGGCAGDLNEDGYPDLIVTQWGADRVFLNEGGHGFREATQGSGLVGERWGTSAALLDFDGDGHLDLVVVNYLAFDPERIAPKGSDGCVWKGHAVMCGPEGLVPLHDQLYRGLGDGRFEECSQRAGFTPERAGFGLGVMTLDYDRDGDTDLYISNDSTPNHLWENQGDGRFRELGFERGVARDANGKEQAGMGIACADWSGDGRPDLFVTNFSGESNALYRSSRKTSFRERAASAGLGGPSLTRLGWGAGFGDLDLDGELDLFVLNGHVYPEADRPGTDTSYAQPDMLFRGGAGGFAPEPLYDGPDRCSRAGALADLDGDGDLDLVALSVEGGVRVLRNEHKGGGHWLGVRLRARTGNREGLGALVELVCGERTRSAEIKSCAGFQAGVPAMAHFGLGAATQVDALRIHWPGGAVQEVEVPAVDRVLVVEREPPSSASSEEGER